MSHNLNFGNLLHLILPQELNNYFEVKEINEEEERIEIFLEELNLSPVGYKKGNLLSKGFYESIVIQDFPIRERSVFLNIKRRKWKEKTTNKIIHRDWNTVAQGTHLTQEFADFLKELLRKTRNKQ